MLMKRIASLLICIGSVVAAQALDVVCEAGLLSRKISDPQTVTELVVTGTADASDFYFIDRYMPALRSLDISSLYIREYTGEALGGRRHYPGGTIPAGVFAGSSIASLLLPCDCAVGDFAFSGCPLREVTLPAGTVLGDGVFAYCTDLEKVSVSAGVSVGRSAFRGCVALAAVDGSAHLAAVPASAFEDCAALGTFAFGSGLRSVGEGAFARTALAEVAMEECTSLDSIGAWAFAGDAALVRVVLPAHLAAVGEGAFFECTSLTGITLPDGMTSLPPYVLKDAAALQTLELPAATERVGQYALMGVSGVSAIELPASLQMLGHGAMEGMSSLAHIDAASLTAVPSLGDDVWASVEQGSVQLHVDPSLAQSFLSTPQWQEFKIENTSTGTGAATVADKTVRAAFAGTLLIVESSVCDISSVEVYDVSGRTLFSVAADSGRVGIDTSHSDASVYIVACTLADGTRGTVKIVR